MGKNANRARTNGTVTQVLPRTEQNRILSSNEPNRTREPKCRGSYSVLSLNEIIGTFTHFTVNEAFYFSYANLQVDVPA